MTPPAIFQVCVILLLVISIGATVFLLRQTSTLRAALRTHQDQDERDRQEAAQQIGRLSRQVETLADGTRKRLSSHQGDSRDPARLIQTRLENPPAQAQNDLEKAVGKALRSKPLDGAPVRPSGAQPRPRSEELDLPLLQAARKAHSLYAAGQYSQSASIYSWILDQQPENAEARLYRAISLYRHNSSDSGCFSEVEKDLISVIRQGAGNAEAFEILGAILAEQGKMAEGLEWLACAIALQPGNPDLLRKAGICALYAKEYGRSQQYLDAACSLAPADAELWVLAGNAYAAAGDRFSAESRWKRSLFRKNGGAAEGDVAASGQDTVQAP